jgi:hypothetical protein
MNLKHKESYHEKHLMNPASAKRWDLAWWGDMKEAAEQGDATAKRLMKKFHNRPAEELYLVANSTEHPNLKRNP